ncbi:hypothetical protein [Streptococcus gordonii]|jgi:hypothetical protein|uniref:hypothetical protein n=1 Tax=Streptococcus gordonii TaxID=1302 RepID=UPI00200080ED|nr:hypothetical protein [Streptococcus gordonii]DAJ39612.1 MAG TPA: hypothetical protein [Caudoviricetes sp.]
MEENILLAIITELNQQLSDKTLNEVEYKVRLNDAQQKLVQLYDEVEVYRSVLESDKDLKDLFEEIKNKNEVTANGL